jgi:hypothetical protein
LGSQSALTLSKERNLSSGQSSDKFPVRGKIDAKQVRLELMQTYLVAAASALSSGSPPDGTLANRIHVRGTGARHVTQ